MLSAHLRQLAAAGLIIQDHVVEGHMVSCVDISHMYPLHTGPAPPAAARLFTSLALMHALRKQVRAKHYLITRLDIACAAYIKESAWSLATEGPT